MSLFSVKQKNDLKLRAEEIYGEKFFTKDPETKEWVPLTGGGGGGGDLPYYLKPNSVEISGDADGESAVLGSYNVTAQRDGEQFHLTPSGLAFIGGETNILTSQKTKMLTQLKSTIDAIPINAGKKSVVWDKSTQNFTTEDVRPYLKTSSIDFGGGSLLYGSVAKVAANGGDEYAEIQVGTGNVSLTMETTNVDSKMELNEYSLSLSNKAGTTTSTLNRANLKQVEDLHAMLEATTPNAGANNVLTAYNPNTKKLVRNPPTATLYAGPYANLALTPTSAILTGSTSSVNMIPTSIRVGGETNYAEMSGINTINPYFAIRKTAGTKYQLEMEDIQVTNKLKFLAEKVPTSTHRMLTYDYVTKAFNYSTIPSGSASVPSYVQPTKLVIPRPISYDLNSTQIDLTNVHEGVTTKLRLSDRALQMTRTDLVNPDQGADIDFTQFKALAEYKVPKNFWAELTETKFQHVSMTGASSGTEAKVSFLPGGATQAPYFNLPEGGKMFLQVTGLNRSNATKCYGIRLPFFGGNGNLSQYRFTFNVNADIVYSGAFSEVFVQNEKVNVYRYLETPSNDANIKAGSYFFYISDPLAIGPFTGTIIIERLSDDYESYTKLTPT